MFWRFTLRLVAKKKKDAKRRPFYVVEMRGIDVLFALLRRENHTELLPQFAPRPCAKRKSTRLGAFHLVEMAGIEPASELPSIKLSTSVFSLLRFPRV